MKKTTPCRILIIDDEENMRHMLASALGKEGYLTAGAADGRAGLALAAEGAFDCILCDLKMPVMDGLEFLSAAREQGIEATIIMMSAFATIDTAVQAMRQGAYDFITKPFKIEAILCTLAKAEERLRLHRENRRLRDKVAELDGASGFAAIIGASPAIADLRRQGEKVAAYDTTVLITGESGTGKELVARGIHQASPRRDKPFITVNCGAIPGELLESEFFGHLRGAFTGAERDHQGLFAAAEGGTLLLDEIGELPLGLQVKLLRVLQEREVRPVGATSSRPVNVRVLAATARDLGGEIAAGRFRQDLFFRLNVVELRLPPLRQRVEDIPLLASHFLRCQRKRLGRPIAGITREAIDALARHTWPGNVRELHNVLEHAIIYADDGWVRVDNLPILASNGKGESVGQLLVETISIKQGKILMEKQLIEKALLETSGNRSQAAELLEISYPSLLNKIKGYGI